MRAMKLTAALFAVLLAAPALVAQNQTVRIHAATVLDGTGKTLKNATIVVQGSKITSIETGSAAGADYELGQLTLVPGLIDVHAHVGWHFDKDGRYAARDRVAQIDVARRPRALNRGETCEQRDVCVLGAVKNFL